MDREALFQRYYQPMYRAAAAYLRDHGADRAGADDAINTVMARILNWNPSTPDPENWEAYLITAVLHAASDLVGSAAHRREHPHPFDTGHERDTDGDHTDGVGERRRSRGRRPDPLGDHVAHAIDQQRQLAHVLTILDTLPADQQTVIRQILLAGRSGRQVANDLGVSEGRVSQLKKAALATLNQALVGEAS
jgi:RNA polymerase sigma-70 factor (ECF subfamily)